MLHVIISEQFLIFKKTTILKGSVNLLRLQNVIPPFHTYGLCSIFSHSKINEGKVNNIH